MTEIDDIIKEHEELRNWSILTAYRGSIAHGMYTANNIDDKDALAICVLPEKYYIGLHEFANHDRRTREIKVDEWDIVVHDIRKAINLLAKGNPNMLTALWCESEHYVSVSAAGHMLLACRSEFSCRHVFKSFAGYARDQLAQMERKKHAGYMGAKRKALVEKFGYDTKNAAHAIRLLRMAVEFMRHGRMQVYRIDDAAELMDIKRGEWTMEQVQQEAEALFAIAESAYHDSRLPDYPNMEMVSALCMDVIATAWKSRLYPIFNYKVEPDLQEKARHTNG